MLRAHRNFLLLNSTQVERSLNRMIIPLSAVITNKGENPVKSDLSLELYNESNTIEKKITLNVVQSITIIAKLQTSIQTES